MKRYPMIAVLAAFVLLTACGKQPATQTESVPEETAATAADATEAETEPAATEEETAAETVPAETETAPAETEAPTASNNPGGYHGIQQPDTPLPERPVGMIYREALENLRDHEIFPDGTTAQVGEVGCMDDNQFAVFDIDGDGRDELIIRYTQATGAGMVEMVYDVNTNESLFEELVVWPDITYYEGGLVKVMASHLQGYSGEFWPYSVYQYDPETDTYALLANVDALSRDALIAAGREDEAYPEDADTSGSGMVYFIGSDDPVDVTDYEAWYNALFGSAKEIEIPYYNLDEEAVEAVG